MLLTVFKPLLANFVAIITLWETDKKFDEERMREEAAKKQADKDEESGYLYETDRILAEEAKVSIG